MSSDQKQEVRVHIRWMIRRDMAEILAIEAESYGQFAPPEPGPEEWKTVLGLRKQVVNDIACGKKWSDAYRPRQGTPWLEEDFIRCLRQRNCIEWVAVHDEQVVGFMIHKLYESKIRLLTLVVATDYRRRGVDSQMVAKLIGKLTPKRRTRLVAKVRETNLPAQLFFRASGFRAVSVLRDYYEDTPEDAYAMQYRIGSNRAGFVPTNRISEFTQ
jgi:ribosomal-protein-alanine N-acetyltransferase